MIRPLIRPVGTVDAETGSPIIRASFVFRRGRGLSTVVVLITTPGRWRRMQPQHDDNWQVVRQCGLVLAVKME